MEKLNGTIVTVPSVPRSPNCRTAYTTIGYTDVPPGLLRDANALIATAQR